MDYHRPLNESCSHPKVHIALIMIPGNHTGCEEYSTSPLLLNPGGPGGSGVDFALGIGPQIQSIVGADQDVIGFDPRGIGSTTPRADCFAYPPKGSVDSDDDDVASGNFHRLLWTLGARSIGLVNSSSDSLKLLDARTRSLAKLCGQKDTIAGKDSILKYLHTPSVATDMLSIIDAWDVMRVSATVQYGSHGLCTDSVDDKEPIILESGDSYLRDTTGKLVYWGYSYGVGVF